MGGCSTCISCIIFNKVWYCETWNTYVVDEVGNCSGYCGQHRDRLSEKEKNV